jgi:hypothetical protein
MLMSPGEVSMSDSAAPGSSATDMRRSGLLHFWLLVAAISVWTEGAGIGLPGGGWYPDDAEEPEEIRCPKCHKPATLQQGDGSYKCANDHISRKQSGGSYKWEKDPSYVPPKR